MEKYSDALKKAGFDLSDEASKWLDYWQSLDMSLVILGKNSGKLAEEHWSWLETLLHKVYVDAFNHGYKHGKEARL